MARRFERDHGRASHAGPRRGRRGRDDGGGEVVGAPGDARRLAVITGAMVVAFDLAHGLSALPYRLFPGDDVQAWEVARHPGSDPMPFTPTTQWVLRLFGALDAHVDAAPSVLGWSTLAALSVALALLSRLAFRLTGSVPVAVAAMALLATSGWTATYVHWWSYAPLTAMFALALFSALELADRRSRWPWAAALVAGVCAALCAGTGVSAMAAVGVYALVFGARWWGGADPANATRVVAFTGAFGAAAIALFNWKAWVWHIYENLASPHLEVAAGRFGAVPRPPLLPGLWALWVYSPLTLVALCLGTLGVALRRRLRPDDGPIGPVLPVLALVWLHLLVVDALPTTKLARTHFAMFPLVCLALAMMAARSRAWVPARLLRGYTAALVVGALVTMGHGLAVSHDTWRRRHVGPRTMAQAPYRGRTVLTLVQDPHAPMLRQWLAPDRAVLSVGVTSLAAALAAHPDAVLVLGPAGAASGVSVVSGGVLEDFVVDPRVTRLLATARLATVPYYADHRPFFLEEEVCQGLLYRGSVGVRGPGARAGVLLATWR